MLYVVKKSLHLSDYLNFIDEYIKPLFHIYDGGSLVSEFGAKPAWHTLQKVRSILFI